MSEPTKIFRSRRAARTAIFQALYQLELNGWDAEEAIEDALDWRSYSEDAASFIRRTVRDITDQIETIDERIRPFLADGWDYARIALTDKSALRLATFELWSLPDISPATTINEAVTLAKEYGSLESGRFVNGLLGNLVEVSPKADWDRSQDTPREPVEDPVSLDPEGDEPVLEQVEEVEEGTPEYKQLIRAGSWKIKSGSEAE